MYSRAYVSNLDGCDCDCVRCVIASLQQITFHHITHCPFWQLEFLGFLSLSLRLSLCVSRSYALFRFRSIFFSPTRFWISHRHVQLWLQNFSAKFPMCVKSNHFFPFRKSEQKLNIQWKFLYNVNGGSNVSSKPNTIHTLTELKTSKAEEKINQMKLYRIKPNRIEPNRTECWLCSWENCVLFVRVFAWKLVVIEFYRWHTQIRFDCLWVGVKKTETTAKMEQQNTLFCTWSRNNWTSSVIEKNAKSTRTRTHYTCNNNLQRNVYYWRLYVCVCESTVPSVYMLFT